MKIRKLNAATALGSLTASVALLAGMSGAHAQGAPGAGSFPGSFLVPGTQTSFKVGGYIKWDYTYDFGQVTNINGGTSPLGVFFDANTPGTTADAGHHVHGGSQMTASESRFNIETRTPTSFGELKTFIEGDFTNPNGLSNSNSLHVNSNSFGFRLRQAYGTLGPFLAGQTLSLFRDGAAEAETLDFGGAQATGRTRDPQIRYTFDFGNGLTAAVAAENPQTQVTFDRGGDVGGVKNLSTFGAGTTDKIPDFTTAVNYNAPWGHLKGAAVFRDVYWHTFGETELPIGCSGAACNPLDAPTASSKFGWAVAFTGNWNVPIGKDSFAWEAAGGKGGGAYVNSDGPPTPDAVLGCDEAGCSIKTIWSYLAAANYTHFWTDTLRSNIAGSYWHQVKQRGHFDETSDASGMFAWTYTGHVNLIWSPVPQTNFGVEYMWEEGRLVNGQHGRINRVQASAQFKF